MDKYNIVKTIGDGTYGSVVKALNTKTGNIYYIIYLIILKFIIHY